MNDFIDGLSLRPMKPQDYWKGAKAVKSGHKGNIRPGLKWAASMYGVPNWMSEIIFASADGLQWGLDAGDDWIRDLERKHGVKRKFSPTFLKFTNALS